MQRTSLRTLVLLLELFAAVVAVQYLTTPRPVKASAVWLADDWMTNQPPPGESLHSDVDA